jgi:MFS family permease
MRLVRTALSKRWRVTADALSVPDLRRLNVAYLGSQLAGWAYLVAIGVYAFDHGGASQVALMTVIRFVPAVVAAPFAGSLADRYPRRHVLVAVDMVRGSALAVAGVLVMSGAPPTAVYVAVAFSALAGTAFEPAKAALLPTLAHTAEQLTAANALGATIESTGLTLGPALGGLLLTVGSVQLVFFTLTGASVLSAVLVSRIAGEPVQDSPAAETESVLRRSLAGFSTIARDRTLRTVVSVFGVQMLAFGLLNVFLVAIGLQELHIGAGGVGWLNAAAGVGGILGGVLTVSLAGRRLAKPLALGMCLLGLGYLLAALIASEPAALIAMLLMNLGGLYVDIATFTLLQRAVDETVLARAFSVIGTIIVGSLLVGGGLAPALISLLGLRLALGVTGGAILIAIAVALPALVRIDAAARAPLDGLSLLRELELFKHLPVPLLEQLAADLVEQSAADGEVLVTQGEPGDAYYVIATGAAVVSVDGKQITHLGPGDGFGEIALLLQTPRSATVTAAGDTQLVLLMRDLFLTAIAGNEETRRAGQAIAQGLLSRARPVAMPI